MKDEKYKERLDVNEIDPIILFMVLYNNSKQQGMGFLDTSGRLSIPYTKQGMDEALALLLEQPDAINQRHKISDFKDEINELESLCSGKAKQRGRVKRTREKTRQKRLSVVKTRLKAENPDLINEWINFQPKTLDYVRGRVMKCDINGIELDTWGYDRDNGEGAAQACIDEAMEIQDDNSSLFNKDLRKMLDEDKEAQDGV